MFQYGPEERGGTVTRGVLSKEKGKKIGNGSVVGFWLDKKV